MIPVLKTDTTFQSVSAKSKSKEKLGSQRSQGRNLPAGLGISHSSKQILLLDPALIHRAMHEDIKGAIPAYQKSARVIKKPASICLKKELQQKHFQSAVLTPNQFLQSHRDGQSCKSNIQSVKKVDVSTISQSSGSKKLFTIPKPLLKKKEPLPLNLSKPKKTSAKKPLLAGSSSFKLTKAQNIIPFKSDLIPSPIREQK